jgi:hypothetical protein
VEDIIAEVEAQMENAADITKVISAGNMSGTINGMSGIEYSEQELEDDLAELLDEPGERTHFPGIPVLRKTSNVRLVEQAPTIETVVIQQPALA